MMDDTLIALEQAIQDYLEWMAVNGYAKSTQQGQKCTLRYFRLFIDVNRYHWDDIFTRRTLNRFKKAKGKHHAHAVSGLSRYLYAQGKIARPIRVRKALPVLPAIYEDYLLYRKKYRHASDRLANHIRRVLYVFDGYCQRNDIQLRSLKIDHVDAFRNECFNGFAGATRRVYRIYLRGFLSYLHSERQVLPVDLAPLVTGRREYGKAKPPKFLRPAEVQQLFASLDPSSASGLRTYGLVHLAYSMGMRPIEISQLRLEDIGFSRQLMRIAARKGDNPLELPIPEHTLKAMAAYIIGARPKTKHRRLFLTLQPPHRPMTPNAVGGRITFAMEQAGLNASAYWLRHTYAQNLLEAGASVFDIKEMLGHDKIESTKKYLCVHTRLMRKVLFDETL
ncbi:MAG: tyrosine-type recombinase/integrase [Desulfosarcina sp.]